jgi:hypothetical protein
MMAGSPADVTEMALMGLETSLVAPAILLLSRSWPGWQILTWPAAVAMPAFLVAHLAITVWMSMSASTVVTELVIQVALIAVSLVFWLPVVARDSRLTEAGRMVYLFLAMPAMDLAGVFVVLNGDSRGGLAMIVAMLPVGVVAVASTWRWIAAEEAAEAGSSGNLRHSVSVE